MSSKPKRFATGMLNATANSQIYAVPRAKIVTLRGLLFHNMLAARSVRVAINVDGTSYEIDAADLAIRETLIIEYGLILQGTDTVEAWQTAGADVNFVLWGLEMDA